MKNIVIRENNLDLLRIFATFVVIIDHVGANRFWTEYSSDWGNIYAIFSKFGVPLFLMLSGAFILRKK